MTKREKALLIFTIYLLHLYSSTAVYNALAGEASSNGDIVRLIVFCLVAISGFLFVFLGDDDDQA